MNLLVIAFGLSMAMHGCTNRAKVGQENLPETATGHLALIKATSQQWTAGIKGGGSGTEYTFVVEVQTTEVLSFGEVILDGQPYTPTVLKQGRTVGQAEQDPQMGDTLNLRVSTSGRPSAPKDGLPAATIHYSHSGMPQTLEVPVITMLATQQRP